MITQRTQSSHEPNRSAVLQVELLARLGGQRESVIQFAKLPDRTYSMANHSWLGERKPQGMVYHREREVHASVDGQL